MVMQTAKQNVDMQMAIRSVLMYALSIVATLGVAMALHGGFDVEALVVAGAFAVIIAAIVALRS